MRRHQPALLGGLFIGVLSALPLVNAGNLCCCLWVVSGGAITVYLLQQNLTPPVETGDAVLAGLQAGLLGALLYLVVSFGIFSVSGPVMQQQLGLLLEQNPQVPPEMRDSLVNMFAGPGFMVVMAAITLPLFAVFGVLGALLGLAIFRKKMPPGLPPGATPPTVQTL
jgi:hypothetical protein